MAVEVGQVLDGKYRIIRLIGKGGMGAVYEAMHLLIDRRVAVKELHASAAAAEHAIVRFEREARAAGRIGSDHILQIFDIGVLPDGSRYMVSEFLDGETLDSRIRRIGRLPPAELLPIAQQLLTGLGAAHQALVLHRDLKPDNIFLVRQKSGAADFVKIIDFGIAKFQPGVNPEDALRMTETGAVVGTPYYLSPEQARGTGEADARSDLYAVGVILYECITGVVPFDAPNFNDLIFKIVLEKPRPPTERMPGIDQGLSDLILKAMARDPAARFQSAQEMMGALTAWATSDQGSSTVNLGPSPLTPPRVQTLISSEHPLSPGSGAAWPDVSLRTLASPTPASFGKTRDPRLSTPAVPLRSKAPLVFLSLGGAVLVLFVVGFIAFWHVQSKDPAAAEGVALPVASSAPNAPLTVAPPPTDPPAPAVAVSPATSTDSELPLSASVSNSEVPRAQSPKLGAAPRTQSPKQAAAAPAAPAAAARAPSTRTPLTEPQKPTPSKRSDWGY